MKKKLLIIVPVLLVVLGGAYKFALAKPAEKPEPKVHGEVYVLPKDFLLNLESGQFVRLNVALVLEHGSLAAAAAGGGHGGGAPVEPPEGFGPLPQEAVVRDVVTDRITNSTGPELIERKGRAELKHAIKESIEKHTDVKVEEVLFTDVAVQ
jgi:flagellar FliL protein